MDRVDFLVQLVSQLINSVQEVFTLEYVVVVEVHAEQLIQLLVQHEYVHVLSFCDEHLVDFGVLYLVFITQELLRPARLTQSVNSEHLHHGPVECVEDENLAPPVGRRHDGPADVERTNITVLREHNCDVFGRRKLKTQPFLNILINCIFLVYFYVVVEHGLVHYKLIAVVAEQPQFVFTVLGPFPEQIINLDGALVNAPLELQFEVFSVAVEHAIRIIELAAHDEDETLVVEVLLGVQ